MLNQEVILGADLTDKVQSCKNLMTVMVVEDEPLIRSIFAEELRERGLCVIEAASGDEAWRILRAGIVVDFVFSDIVMPGSIDGNELARRLNAADPTVKILLASGNSAASPDVKIEHFLQKPYQPYLAIDIILRSLGLIRP